MVKASGVAKTVRLPYADRAIVDAAKLRDYCLSRRHPRGRHKARVFASRLGFTEEHADVLRSALLDSALNSEAMKGEEDSYGQRYMIDFEVAGPLGKAAVRSSWIILTGEQTPRLTSCFVL